MRDLSEKTKKVKISETILRGILKNRDKKFILRFWDGRLRGDFWDEMGKLGNFEIHP